MAKLVDDGSAQSIAAFWNEILVAGAPLIEPYNDASVLVTFLWRGEAPRTRVWFGVNAELTRLPGSDVWYDTQILPADLITIYGMLHGEIQGLPSEAVVSGPAHLDPLNPHRVFFPGDPGDPSDRDNWASLLKLPNAPTDQWTVRRPGVTPGSLLRTSIFGKALGGERTVTVYRPPGAPPGALPALVVFDGYLAQTMLDIPTTLDNLIAAGRIPAMAALFVHTRDDRREQDLVPTPPIDHFITGELLPWAHDELSVGGDGIRNLIAGVSRGGLTATYLGLRRPDLFSGVVAHSGSFWWPSPAEGRPGRLIDEVPAAGANKVRFYLDVGNRETMPGPGGASAQLDVNRKMRDVLRANGHQVTYAEYCGGHDYVNWRRTFADGLLAVCGL
ncbi:alpha/beta hydrolase-fold protein [Actinoplanes sp. KI2]|uniref:alpha/beta hydrolase-fold protein n=1 Tax=Actinoplanes sp. KI2 TaxID=2983315 RepID=UPI0021D58A84|nr:alpha/beta hydrolase-fold protein [Actinoplanes sp. KI2]MCU7725227.1 alpha/beta hydrolase-fold protein [Actinoplanes sp. KI2]